MWAGGILLKEDLWFLKPVHLLKTTLKFFQFHGYCVGVLRRLSVSYLRDDSQRTKWDIDNQHQSLDWRIGGSEHQGLLKVDFQLKYESK